MKKVLILIASIAVPLLLGAWASIPTMANIPTWYSTLNKPSFNPPNWLFGPVWTLLYTLMGISFFLIIISTDTKDKRSAITISVIQMILNTAWSFLFFEYHLMGWALADILLLWICIIIMILTYYPIKKSAALLQIPYLLWVSFATMLNAAYLYLN